VARTGHFGAAAEQCAVTQPALSMQIQELEKELGLQLLERGRKGVGLTAGGREIAGRAARVLADVRDLVDSARHLSDGFSGPFRLGAIPSIAPYLLPQLLPLMRARHPDLDLHLRETQTQRLLEELVDGDLDLVLLALPVEHPGVETFSLFEDRFLLAVPASRPIAKNVRATVDLLREDRLLLLEEGHCLRDQALAFCHLRKVESIDTFGASSLSTIVQMVSNGLGLTLRRIPACSQNYRHKTPNRAEEPLPVICNTGRSLPPPRLHPSDAFSPPYGTEPKLWRWSCEAEENLGICATLMRRRLLAAAGLTRPAPS
jgi:LysR family hydrogen peroxide-inducible transcriptional activator